MHRVGVGQCLGYKGMAGLVESGNLFLSLADDTALLFWTGNVLNSRETKCQYLY
jgi:hypothetical protein